jgi:FtsP/CotA-like multicopper oxidase with cupredoxin domain
MKSFFLIACLFLIGCDGKPISPQEIKYDSVTILVKKKEIQTITKADWHNTFRQQAVILDDNGNEYRFNVGSNLTTYNLLMINKKYIVYSYNGYLSKIEETK